MTMRTYTNDTADTAVLLLLREYKRAEISYWSYQVPGAHIIIPTFVTHRTGSPIGFEIRVLVNYCMAHLLSCAHIVRQGTLREIELLDGHPQRAEIGLPIDCLLGRRYIEGEVELFLQQSIFTGLVVDHPCQVLDKEAAEVINRA